MKGRYLQSQNFTGHLKKLALVKKTMAMVNALEGKRQTFLTAGRSRFGLGLLCVTAV
jgi:hypothetical protein